MQDSEDLATIRDVADALLVTPNTIRRWVRAGKFPQPRVTTPGGYMRFALGDVEQAVAWFAESARARRQGLATPPAPWSEKASEVTA